MKCREGEKGREGEREGGVEVIMEGGGRGTSGSSKGKQGEERKGEEERRRNKRRRGVFENTHDSLQGRG